MTDSLQNNTFYEMNDFISETKTNDYILIIIDAGLESASFEKRLFSNDYKFILESCEKEIMEACGDQHESHMFSRMVKWRKFYKNNSSVLSFICEFDEEFELVRSFEAIIKNVNNNQELIDGFTEMSKKFINR